MTHRTDDLSWLPREKPPGESYAPVQPAGLYWEAIRCAVGVGALAVDKLAAGGHDAFAVLVDTERDVMTFFVEVGTVADWPPLRHVQALGMGEYVDVPPETERGPGCPYWLRWPERGGVWRVPAALLWSALGAAVDELHPGPVKSS